MGIKGFIFMFVSLLYPLSINAALLERLDGLAYFDDESNLTWLSDVNYIVADGYSQSLIMTWDEANSWVSSLNVSGVTGWRLPTTLLPDSSCENNNEYGAGCSASEMGNLYYNVLGNSAGSITNTGPFTNVVANYSWTSTNRPSDDMYAMLFNMSNGDQRATLKTNTMLAWAVFDGDVSAVPLPASLWLFGSGLFGLIGLARRKANT